MQFNEDLLSLCCSLCLKVILMNGSIFIKSNQKVEDSPHDTLASLSIGDFLYSTKGSCMQDYVDKIKHLKNLQKEPAKYWTNLMNKYMIDQNTVVVIGDPSEEKMEQSGKEEKERVKRQREELGEEGLAKRKKLVDEAIAENSVCIDRILDALIYIYEIIS